MGFVVNTERGYLTNIDSVAFSNDKNDATVFENSLDKMGRRRIYEKLVDGGEVNRYWYEEKK